VLAAVSLATLMMVLDFMAVAVALPAVHRSLDASFQQLEWVLEAFVLTLAALVLTAGRITDVVGRRPVFLWGLVVFGVGSLLAGLAQTPYPLIGARVVQGIGGALLFATGPVLLTETFRGARGRVAVAVWGAVTGVAIASSPIVGGEVASALGWRWLFLLEVPVSVLALLIGFVAIKEPLGDQGEATLPPSSGATNQLAKTGGKDKRVPMVDRRGFVLFTAAIVILVIGLVGSTTAVEGFWQNGIVACFIMTGLLLIGFVAWETVARAPMLDVSMFRERTFTASSLAAFGLSMAVLGPVLCLVFYMAFDQGYSELTIGTHLLLLTIVTLPFLPLTGFLDKYFPVRLLICSGLVLVAVGLWLISRLSAAGTLSELVPGLIVAGVGLELVNPRLASAAAATVQPPAAAIASRAISTFRQIGTATGVAVFGAIFVTQLSDHISDRTAGFAQLVNENPTIASLVLDGHTAQAVSSAPAAVRSQILSIIQSGFAGAIHDVFFVAALVASASAVLALLTRSSDLPRSGARQLRTQSLATQSLGTQHSGKQKSGNGSAAGRTAAPSPNGARPEPAVPTTPAYTTSAAATLAAIGITVETPSVPDELTTFDEADIPGELARLRELAALDVGAPDDTDLDAPVDTDLDAPVDSEPAPDLADPSGPDGLTTIDEVDIPGELAKLRELAEAPEAEPELAEAPEVEPELAERPAAFIAKDQAVGAWPGWSGWEAPDEEPVLMAVESPPADETVADFLSYWHLAETPGPATVDEIVVADTGPGATGVLAETGPEGAGSPDELGTGRRWVRGQVTASTGEPLAGALVTLVNADGDEAAHAIVGSDGSFAVGDMCEGTYTLIVAAPHFRPSANTFAVGSEEAPAALSLTGIGSLAGKVTSAKDGQPMSVDIELVSPEEGVSGQGRTGKDGCFLLSDVAEGSYELVAWSPGYRTVEVPVVVERAETLTVVVAMVGLGHVYGAVTGPGGEWVPGAQITLTDRTGMVVATTWTDGAGSYRFSEVPEGAYTVRAAAFDAACPVVEVEAGSTVAADVTLASP
jgi:MFS family permease